MHKKNSIFFHLRVSLILIHRSLDYVVKKHKPLLIMQKYVLVNELLTLKMSLISTLCKIFLHYVNQLQLVNTLFVSYVNFGRIYVAFLGIN